MAKLKRQQKYFDLLWQLSWQGPWPLFNRHSFTSKQSPCVINYDDDDEAYHGDDGSDDISDTYDDDDDDDDDGTLLTPPKAL